MLSRIARVVAVASAGCIVATVAAVAPVQAAPEAFSRVTPLAGATLPTQLIGVGSAQQLIVVTDPTPTMYATLTAYQKVGALWHRMLGLMTARIGRNGFVKAANRVQGTGTTPTGSFVLGPSFGSGTSPGTAMPYRRFDSTDRWVYDKSDPSTYNTYQPSGNWGNQEKLSQIKYGQYRYAVVIGYNHPVMSMSASARPHASAGVNTKLGGGIFLHVTKYIPGNSHSEPTAGCVSVDLLQMKALLKWLNPAKNPRIIIGSRSTIVRSSALNASSAVTPLMTTRTIGYSRAGRAIMAYHRAGSSPTRELVVIGVIHGDERKGLAVTTLLTSLKLPTNLGVWIIPTMNPDGMRSDVRGNARGVDLNRNFPYSWRSANAGTSRWSGPSAASEPETKAVKAFLSKVKPKLVVIFHSPLGGVDSYGAKSLKTVKRFAKAAGYPVGYFDCAGGCHGTLTQWFNHSYSGQAITFEFGSAAPSRSSIQRVATALTSVASSL